MRVGILGWLHESNTFIRDLTTLEHFHQDLWVQGRDVRTRLADTPHEVGGFFAGLDEAGVEAYPLLAARAVPHGPLSAECFATIRQTILESLENAPPLDGLLVAAHGAMVSEPYLDADGEWLTSLQARVGSERKIPIITTLDPHANLSPAMVAACDALIAYRTNPHLDQRARGVEAARMMVRTLRGEIRPTMAARFPPMVINIERQETSAPHWQELLQSVEELRTDPRVLSCSVLLGFPYADVPEMGASIVVVTDDDRDGATARARQLEQLLWDARMQFVGKLVDIPAALDQASSAAWPVCLLDMGDNVGGGSPADATWLAHALRERRMGPSFVCLYDPESVERCRGAGEASRLELSLGGKTDNLHGPPLTGSFRILRLTDGRFREPQPRHGGASEYDQGRTAIVVDEDARLTVMLTSRRMPPFSLCQLTAAGVDPSSFRYLVAKGVNAPIAAYSPVCNTMIRVNTPGCTTADLNQLPYARRRNPLFPW